VWIFINILSTVALTRLLWFNDLNTLNIDSENISNIVNIDNDNVIQQIEQKSDKLLYLTLILGCVSLVPFLVIYLIMRR